ncbi:MAG: Flp pilus assembly protein CpaB [Candidatus Korobacteraceae bacterium]
MNPRRLLVALLAALLLSGAVTYFLTRRIGGKTGRAAAQTTQKYVAASRPLQAGELLKPDNLTLVEWPAKMPLEGAFTKIEEVSGRAVIYPVAARQPVLEAYLAVVGSGIGLTVKIPEGMRAAAVHSDEVIGVAGFLFPGSHVDVLVTFRSDTITTSSTQIVLQDVEVLTVGQKTDPEPGGKAENVGVVTLLLKPEDAQKLVLASTQGTIHFVLRNGADRGRVAAVPVRVAELSGGARSDASAARAHVVAKHPYEVETIMGDKHVTSQFE